MTFLHLDNKIQDNSKGLYFILLKYFFKILMRILSLLTLFDDGLESCALHRISRYVYSTHYKTVNMDLILFREDDLEHAMLQVSVMCIEFCACRTLRNTRHMTDCYISSLKIKLCHTTKHERMRRELEDFTFDIF